MRRPDTSKQRVWLGPGNIAAAVGTPPPPQSGSTPPITATPCGPTATPTPTATATATATPTATATSTATTTPRLDRRLRRDLRRQRGLVPRLCQGRSDQPATAIIGFVSALRTTHYTLDTQRPLHAAVCPSQCSEDAANYG
jgi:Predicted solute binding protein